MWQQFWIGQGGVVTEYRESTWVNGALQFTAHAQSTTGADNLLRLTFRKVDDKTVRQTGAFSGDGGKTWQLTYDFEYHRRQ
jgi:hypothetical protein